MAKNKVFISKDDEYFWGQGTHYEIYNKLGSHPSTENGKSGFSFYNSSSEADMAYMWWAILTAGATPCTPCTDREI